MRPEMSQEGLLVTAAFITLFLVVSVIATLILARKLETRLIVLGLFLGVAAVLYGLLPDSSVGFRSNFNGGGAGGQLPLPGIAINGQGAIDSLTKLAFIFVLSGIGFALLARWDQPALSETGEKGTHVNP